MNSQKTLESVDKFYLILTLVLIALSILLIFSFRGAFSLFLTAYDLDPSKLPPSAKVNKEDLDTAHNWVFNKQVVRLNNN